MPHLTLQGTPPRPDASPVIATPQAQSQRAPRAATTADYGALKARQKELNNQLSEAQDRREELARDAQQKTGADRAGLETRVGILDQRLSQIESDLTTVGRELAATAPASIAEPPIRIVHRGYDDGDMFGAGFAGAGLAFALLSPFLFRLFRRRRHVQAQTPQSAVGAERIERMEHAIDTIAVEIERVSENQRFMTRLMTETQLAGTIAAVRESAGAAKVAAEGSSHAR